MNFSIISNVISSISLRIAYSAQAINILCKWPKLPCDKSYKSVAFSFEAKFEGFFNGILFSKLFGKCFH